MSNKLVFGVGINDVDYQTQIFDRSGSKPRLVFAAHSIVNGKICCIGAILLAGKRSFLIIEVAP